MPFEDRTLKCKDCNEDFIFSVGEQEYFAQNSLRNEPRHCKICRQMSKMRKEDTADMGGPRRGRGGPRGPGAPRGPRETFQAICAQCGVQTDLPFKPRGDRPVYCRDCFRSKR